jgi:hypothetical protein
VDILRQIWADFIERDDKIQNPKRRQPKMAPQD